MTGGGWMLGAVPGGLVAVGPDAEVAVTLEDPSAAPALVAALADGATAVELAAVAGVAVADATELLGRLRAAGLPPRLGSGGGLAPACAGAAPVAGVLATAEEALVLPPGLPVDGARAALERFVLGLEPDGRRDAYAGLARGAGCVRGDAPDPERLRRRLAEAAVPADAIGVVELAPAGRTWVVPGAPAAVGAREAHRLGPIRRSWPAAPLVLDGRTLHHHLAELAPSTLADRSSPLARRVQGVAPDAALARLIAHAEGAERAAVLRLPAPGELTTAPAGALDGVVPPSALWAPDARRQRTTPAEDPADARPWCPATRADGTRGWLPAGAVFLSLPGSPGSTSSGVAAHPDVAEARRRAFCELVERDALMVVWTRRLARPRIAAASVPPDVAGWARSLARAGWIAHWVDLTLDTLPVVLCCLVSERDGLSVGAACDGDPAAALRRATIEALTHALRLPTPAGPPPRPEAVRDPIDHLHLHRDPGRLPDHGFLWAGPEVALGDLRARPETPEALLGAVGISGLAAEVTCAASAPFRVIRAVAPGLIPLTFGWGREALGLARATEPIGSPHGPVPSPCGGPAVPDSVPHPMS